MEFFWSTVDTIVNLELLSRYGSRLFFGILTTLTLVFSAFFLGFILAMGLCACVFSSSKILRMAARGFIYFFRGTPLLAQLFLVYYGSSQIHGLLESIHLWPFFRDALFCVILTFTLNTAAYQAEILRGSISAIPPTQFEAASALGLGRLVTLIFVIAPQALMTSLRPLGNEFILMLKGSAIASLVTIYDTMGTVTLAFDRSYDFRVYVWATVIYLIIVDSTRRVIKILERRLTRHLQTMPGKTTIEKIKAEKISALYQPPS